MWKRFASLRKYNVHVTNCSVGNWRALWKNQNSHLERLANRTKYCWIWILNFAHTKSQKCVMQNVNKRQAVEVKKMQIFYCLPFIARRWRQTEKKNDWLESNNVFLLLLPFVPFPHTSHKTTFYYSYAWDLSV